MGILGFQTIAQMCSVGAILPLQEKLVSPELLFLLLDVNL